MHDIDRALFELESESTGEYEGETNETLELELAGELLEISNEAELDRFLGDLLGKAVSAGRTFLQSDTGKALTGVVKGVAKKALPQIGQAIGNYVAPGVGGQFGQKAGNLLGGALGLELEGLSQEDRELEASKAFVRFAQNAAQTASQAPPSAPPVAAANRAVLLAAQHYFPGLIPILRRLIAQRGTSGPGGRPGPYPPFPGRPSSREWESSEYEAVGESEYEQALESELAQELLEVSSEAELEQFIGKLMSGVAKFAKSGLGKAVGGVLKSVAKTALPMVGSALGSFVLPGVGTAIGGQLGSMASKLLEVGEAETMSESEAEFEAARRFVQFGRATARYAGSAPRNVPVNTAARTAAIAAARRYAPSLLDQSAQQNWRDRRSGRLGDRDPRARYRSGQRPRGPESPWQWGSSSWPNSWGSYDDGRSRPGPDLWNQPDQGYSFGDDFDQGDQSGFEFE